MAAASADLISAAGSCAAATGILNEISSGSAKAVNTMDRVFMKTPLVW
ncbi:hypothetical protein CFter6_3712 [Collimonas fungivorans]|uniref:Uncharacterized protein n=1 Tax=Collimonas fungivorans TaxID=158899 RepID=A0A127PEW0_9BURK|nr:hypothetical protein CFter6_3712 [Collimonas fungivorans]